MNKKNIIIAIVAIVVIIAIAIGISVVNKDEKAVYTVSFNTDGGNKVVSQQVEEGQKITKPVDPSKEGHEFLGWYLNGKYFDFETVIEGNLTLEARWKEIVEDDKIEIKDDEHKDDEKVEEDKKDEEKEEQEKVTKHTVKFDVDGKIVSTKTVEKNKKVTKPADPTKDGYKFLGWYLGNTKYNFSNKVTKNITLTAKWEKIAEEQPEEEKPNTKPEEEKPNTQPVEPEKPVVKEYTVKFDVDGKIIDTKNVKENEKVNKPSNPAKDGYTFKGWYLDGTEYNFSSKITKNITLTAKWEKKDVVSYEVVDVPNSVANEVMIYVTLNGQRVAGTVEMTSVSGKKVTVDVPAIGVEKTKGTYTSISNPKVK